MSGTGPLDPVHVSLDATAVPPHPAGAGRYCLELAHALARRADIELTIWTRSNDARRWVAPDAGGPAPVTIVPVAPSSRPARLAWEQVRLPRLVARLPVGVHHGPHYTLPAAAKLPRVATIHDLTFFDHPEWHERTKVLLFRKAIRYAVAHADGVVCVSSFTAARLDHLLGPLRPEIVSVIPHGVDHALFRPTEPTPGADAEALASLGIDGLGADGYPFVLSVGTVEPRKDLPTLVAAFGHLRRRHDDLRLVLAGGPGWRDASAQLDRAIDASGAHDRVVRAGYVPDVVLPALLRTAAAVAYPSIEEGFGLPALEAMACGAPLVTTTGSAMEEVASRAALLVPPQNATALAEALDEVLRGGTALADRRRTGIAEAGNFTWDASADAHSVLYRLVGTLPPAGEE